MQGERIAALNEGLVAFKNDLVNDRLASKRVEIAIVTFDSDVRVVQNFVTADKFKPPHLEATGLTQMGRGIEQSLDLITERKKTYRSNGITYYRTWVFMITDGKPEGEAASVVTHAAHRVHEAESDNHVAFFAVGVEDADMPRLSHIVVRPPLELEGLNFVELFCWLSASMQSFSRSEQGDTVTLPKRAWQKKVAHWVEENKVYVEAALTV